MARVSAIYPVSSATGGVSGTTKVAALAAGTSSAEIALGQHQLFMVTAFAATVPAATANLNIRFGPSGMGASATAADVGIPLSGPTNAAPILYFDTGEEYKSIAIFNNSAVAVDVYVTKLNLF